MDKEVWKDLGKSGDVKECAQTILYAKNISVKNMKESKMQFDLKNDQNKTVGKEIVYI